MSSRPPGGRRLVPPGPRAGVTLTELMVAVAIMSVGVLALVGSFANIQRSMQLSKSKTLAANLAQEKLHIVMQQPYYQVIPTPSSSGVDVTVTPNVPYDDTYFPAEDILQGGVTYRRLTYIQVVQEDSGALQVLAPETPDTGMRLITVTVLWTEGGARKKLSLSSVLANPDTVMSSSVLSGKVKIQGTSTGIPGALVTVAENVGWRDTANASGDYSILVSPGPATLVATAQGYHTRHLAVTALANNTVSTDIELTAISSGNVSGTIWLNPGLVVSQVVGSTYTVTGDGDREVEYVLLYNATESPIDVGETGAAGSKEVNLYYFDEDSTYGCSDEQLGLTHVSTYVPAGRSYLIANATWFYAAGGWLRADAYYRPPMGTNNCGDEGAACNGALYCDVLRDDKAGGVRITDPGSGQTIDQVGWSDSDNSAPTYEGSQVNLAAGDGLQTRQLVRITSNTWTASLSALQIWGGAYDSGSNSVDFSSRTSLEVPPRYSTQSGSQTAISGVPAVAAVVSANDGLSDPTTAYATGSPPRAVFWLPNVATGTWTVMISSGAHLLPAIDAVLISSTGSSYVFPSSTSFLDSDAVYGFISGRITNVGGSALSGISVSPGAAGSSQNTAATGRYWLPVSTGVLDVTANPGNLNSTYVSMSSANLAVGLGQIVNGVDFTLSQGGRFMGFITRDGTNALPGIAVAAIDANGSARDTQVSDVNGRFTTLNIATGTYELTPYVDSLETSSPTYITATVTAGQTVHVGTFTVTGALGTISGSVTAGGAPIATGVLIVATTMTFSGSPPAPPTLSTATLSNAAVYITSSREDGTYSVEVRGSDDDTYNIYGYYYPNANGGASSDTYRGATADVQAGQSSTGHDLAW